jgi:hypothetical protein
VLREVVSRSGFANGPVNKAHLHVVPHGALGQVGEGAEFIKTESFGHELILTPKLFKSSVNNLIGVRSTLISKQRRQRQREASSFNWGQININFQSKGEEANRGFLMVEYHKSSAPISLFPF